MKCSPIMLWGMFVALIVALVLSFAGVLGQVAIALGVGVTGGLLLLQWFPAPPRPPTPVQRPAKPREIAELMQELARGRG